MSAGAPLAGRHALVTGAGSGIGAAIARRLAGEGARVTLAGRRREPLEAVGAGLAYAHVAADFDVTDADAIEAGLAGARMAFGLIDILVNNAGAVETAPFARTTRATWDAILAVDLTGVFLVTQAVLPDLVARGAGARVVNVASTAGLRGYAYVSAYAAAKHGVIGLTRSLALELAATGVTVNAVCPGYTDTPLLDGALDAITRKTGRAASSVKAELAASNPQGRLVTPEEVADAVAWLAQPGSSAINGQAIAIAGGEVMA